MPAGRVAGGGRITIDACGESRRAERDPTISVELGVAHGRTYDECVTRAERRPVDPQRREARR